MARSVLAIRYLVTRDTQRGPNCTEPVRFEKCTHGPPSRGREYLHILRIPEAKYLVTRDTQQQDLKQSICILCVRTRTAESCFQNFENRRAGDQTKLFDEKVLVEVEKCTHGPPSNS